MEARGAGEENRTERRHGRTGEREARRTGQNADTRERGARRRGGEGCRRPRKRQFPPSRSLSPLCRALPRHSCATPVPLFALAALAAYLAALAALAVLAAYLAELESSGEDEHVQGVLFSVGHHAILRHRGHALAGGVYQSDVRRVEGGQIVVAEARALTGVQCAPPGKSACRLLCDVLLTRRRLRRERGVGVGAETAVGEEGAPPPTAALLADEQHVLLSLPLLDCSAVLASGP